MAKIDCLMGTCGRYQVASQALACFLQQTALSSASLLIYNQHPNALHFDHDRVRVINEAPPEGSLRHVRRRMLELADPAAEFIHWWDDDDLYLPWHLSDCLEHIGPSVAWKPASSWFLSGNDTFKREGNTFEGSWLLRTDYVKAAPLDTHPDYTDHPVFRQINEQGKLASTELAGRTSYIYRWGMGVEHVSGYGGSANEERQRENLERWRLNSTDTRQDGHLIPADLTPLWRHFLDATRKLVTREEWELNRHALVLALSRPLA
jgi:hypothetical protein